MSMAHNTAAPAVAGVPVTARGLIRRFGEGHAAVEALRGVDLDVRERELVAVMGPSGSGKSTLMHLLAGLDTPTAGSVSIAGTELAGLGDAELTRLRRRTSASSSSSSTCCRCSTPKRTSRCRWRSPASAPTVTGSSEVMAKLGLTDRRSHRPSQLSGGEQQRVAIARALITRPTVLLADEPTGNLDSKTGGEILELLRQSIEDYGQTTVMVTHDPRAALIADRILFIADGLVVKELTEVSAAEVLNVIGELAD